MAQSSVRIDAPRSPTQTAPVGLTNCDRELIHLPGAIQPHGFLLCLDEHSRRIVQVSANTGHLIGLPAEDLLHGGLDQLLGSDRLAEVNGLLPALTATPRLLGTRLDGVVGQPFYKSGRPRLEQTRTTVTVVGLLPTVRGDRVRLQEVFNNLFTNTMKYSLRPDKSITVGLVAPSQLSSLIPATYNTFYVQDDGIGIEDRHQDRIFKLFKRLHVEEKYGGGAGAGLAIAQKMVEKHGGKLWVESTLGHGATFYFTLPKTC